MSTTFPGTTQLMSPEQERMMKLLNLCADVDAFEYEGVAYIGNRVDAIKRFVAATAYPSDFHVWLQQNYKQVN